jgi:hypothetical protein
LGGDVNVTAGNSGSGATGQGGTITIDAGDAASTNGAGGSVNIQAGSRTGTGSHGDIELLGPLATSPGALNGGVYAEATPDSAGVGGAILQLDSGYAGKPGIAALAGGSGLAGNTTGGAVALAAGQGIGTGSGGEINIAAGGSGSGATGDGGTITIDGGNSSSTDGSGGSINLQAGFRTGTGSHGDIELLGPLVTSPGALNGGIYAEATPDSAGVAGAFFQLESGFAGKPGFAGLIGGSATAGNNDGGDGTLSAGDGFGTGSGGGVNVTAGNSGGGATGSGGNVLITGGNATSTNGNGGNITLTPGTGTGSGTNGDVIVNGKLTVTGLIDPTGLVLTEQASDPASTGAAEGTFWVRNDSPNVPMFTDDAGTDWQLAGMGSFVAAATPTWSFQTNTATGFAGGFYEFSGTDDDFSPSITWGTVNVAKAAHFLIVTGAVTVGAVTVRVTGTSITDAGVRTAADTEDIVIPDSTAVSSYFETAKKWNGQVTVATVAGTAVTCNYGWAKYFDLQNQNFTVLGLECLWESDSTDSTSDIELIHHQTTGWTFNAGADPTVPTPVATRSGDYGAENTQEVGQGAWKRANLTLSVNGAGSEGIMFRITSGSTGIGNLSFRNMTLQATCTVP